MSFSEREFMPKHSLKFANWKSSVSLEWEFWRSFGLIAKRIGLTRGKLARKINETRDPEQNLSSAIRVYVLLDAMAKAEEHKEHAAKLRCTVDALISLGKRPGKAKEGLAPISTVIAGGRANA